jgi:hypothetical protein
MGKKLIHGRSRKQISRLKKKERERGGEKGSGSKIKERENLLNSGNFLRTSPQHNETFSCRHAGVWLHEKRDLEKFRDLSYREVRGLWGKEVWDLWGGMEE